ncbi:uncharacterized protein TNCV_4695681 [Trichonephila clavipes]|nr:uncharacterized protein TNCV_4695681 [Trichonephila clavipes]
MLLLLSRDGLRKVMRKSIPKKVYRGIQTKEIPVFELLNLQTLNFYKQVSPLSLLIRDPLRTGFMDIDSHKSYDPVSERFSAP